MYMIICSSDSAGDRNNCVYNHAQDIRYGDIEGLKKAVSTDYTCTVFKDRRRSIANFTFSNCICMDLDNDHSDDPEEWKTPKDIQEAFPGVQFAVHYSRHNMLEKDGKSARPRFHVFFQVDEYFDAGEYAALKRELYEFYPYFDANALDAARFFFGTPDPAVEFYGGGE